MQYTTTILAQQLKLDIIATSDAILIFHLQLIKKEKKEVSKKKEAQVV